MRWFLILLLLLQGFLLISAASAQNNHKADSLEAALKLVNSPDQRIRILLALSEELSNQNDEKGLVFAHEAQRLAEAAGDNKSVVSATITLASIYYKSGSLKQAATSGQQALDLAGKMKLEEEYIRTAMLMGYIYDALGDYTRSTELFFTSLKKSENLDDRKLVSRSLYGIGYTLFSQNNFPKSLEYYQKSLAISRELHDTTGIAGCLNNISAVYGSQNDTQYIERYVREAVAINLKMNNLHWVSINYGNLGSYFLERRQDDSAYSYFCKAWDIASGIGNAAQMAASGSRLAYYFIVKGDLDKGLSWAQEALNLGKRFGLKKQVYETTQLLRDIYLQKKDPEQAYHYDTLRYIIKDSLDLDANNTLLSKLELQYQLEKSAQEKRLAEQKRNAATILSLVILMAFVIVIVLVYLRHRLKTKYYRLEKEKLEKELEYRNKELASNVMALMKKNEILTEIAQKLIDVKQNAVKEETRNAIEHIAGDLQKSMEVRIWNEFELRFRQVHKDFYDKLMQTYPDLSPNEQKLCAFLRLNMTNKEISELTGQSIKALETARYRLRIKFGLSNSQVNLITFLSSI